MVVVTSQVRKILKILIGAISSMNYNKSATQAQLSKL
jgi:hypothetical protein